MLYNGFSDLSMSKVTKRYIYIYIYIGFCVFVNILIASKAPKRYAHNGFGRFQFL